MKPRVTVITIGVDDLERSLRFCREGLGFKTEGIVGKEFEHGAVAFFSTSRADRGWRSGRARALRMTPVSR